jgi:squalene-associated FAD-dependent desaturase
VKIAVVGAGWSGLAAAVRATQAGHEVSVFDVAPMPGGRARSDAAGPDARDNGQHILLGGYARALALMRDVGVDPDTVLQRTPLALRYPDGVGLAMARDNPGPLDAALGLARARGFSALDKLSILRTAAAWKRRRFTCDPSLTVDALLRGTTTARVRERLLEPLCVAALNTPVGEASAAVFLAVMRDSLFGARGACDLLLPRAGLAALLPLPAVAWLEAAGARVHLRRRVTTLVPDEGAWRVEHDGDDGAPPDFDRVILATPATEAARLTAAIAPDWSRVTGALAHEPIVSLELDVPPRPWPAPMLALRHDADRRPAQFAFRAVAAPARGRDRVTLVASAAGDWLARGSEALAAAAVFQYREAFGIPAQETVDCVDLRADRRATFRCTAGISRPPPSIAAGLVAAGDYVAGPYPATLEGAVLSGEAAAKGIRAAHAVRQQIAT